MHIVPLGVGCCCGGGYSWRSAPGRGRVGDGFDDGIRRSGEVGKVYLLSVLMKMTGKPFVFSQCEGELDCAHASTKGKDERTTKGLDDDLQCDQTPRDRDDKCHWQLTWIDLGVRRALLRLAASKEVLEKVRHGCRRAIWR